MATNLVVNGVSYPYPNTGDQQWGNNATNWAIAVTNGMLQKAGGLFTLTADVDFGATYGILANYFKSRSSNIAAAGVFRFAVGDTLNFRNNANSADLALAVNGSDQLTFAGQAFVTTTGTLTASKALVTNGSALITSSSVTSTELGRLSGILSSAVGISDSQTLTNKTIAAGSNTITGLANANLSGSAAITNANLASMAANSIKANNTGGSATPSDITVAQLAAMLTLPTVQKFTSTGTTTGWLFTISTSTTCAVNDTYTNNGNTYTVLAALSAQSGQVLFCSGASAPLSSGTLTRSSGAGTSSITFTASTALATYTTPANCRYIRVRTAGGGGAGAGSGTASETSGGSGSGSFFGANIIVANGGTGGSTSGGVAAGGSASLGTAVGIALTGGSGQGNSQVAGGGGATSNLTAGGSGGNSAFGGGGGGGSGNSGSAGGAGAANTGGGGGGGGGNNVAAQVGGAGGGAGGFVDAIITSPAATYPYVVGTGGSAGGAGTSGFAGGAGGTGLVIVEEFYQ